MKRALLTTLLLGLATAAMALQPCYEPFANSVGLYPTGTSYASGAPGWHQTNAQGDFWYEIDSSSGGPATYLTNFSLTYPGLPTSSGNAIVLTNVVGTGMRMNVANPQILETQNGAKVYYSLLVSLPNITSLTTSGDYCWGLNNGSGDQGNAPSDYHARVYFKKNGTGYQVGLSKSAANAAYIAYDPTVHGTNETLFLVVSYEIVTTNSTGASSTTNDICRLWINPATNTFGAATPPAENTNTIRFPDSNEATSPNTFIIQNRATDLPNVMIVDEFRLGTNWAFVTGAAASKTPPPATKSVAYQGTLSLTNLATGSSSLTYAWQFNGTTISGATNSILTIANVADANAGTYASIVSTGVGNPVTNLTTVTVTGDPQIVTQPTNVNVATGGSGSFSVSAIGTPTLTYQWMENGNPLSDGTSGTGTIFSGTHTATLNFSSVSAADNGAVFTCGVTNGVNIGVVSAGATLTVQDPVILTQPNNVTAYYHVTTNFTVVAAGTAPFSYQWYLNGSPLSDGSSPSGSGATISGSSTATLTLSGLAYQDSGGTYYVVVNNANNSAITSSGATLTVLDPYIATQPTPQTNNAGTTATFTVAANGTPSLSYQWYQNNNPLADGNTVPGGGGVSGSTTPTLTISGVTDANAGNYYVSINGGSGNTIDSSTNALVVIDPVAIVSPPKSLVERAGDHVAFVVATTGTTPAFQWQFNGANIPGATKSALVLTNIQTGSNGTYTVVVSNSINTMSASATLNVVNSPLLPLASTNIIVARIGDGAQSLSATGNTIYLDQYTTNGVYVSTLQVPDENVGQSYGTGSSQTIYGSPALLAQGAGSDAPNSMFLTLSGNGGEYLNFAAYCEQYPFNGSDVTAGGGQFLRGLASINAFGLYTLTYTNQGLYNGGNHTIRGTVTLDGTNFWTTGQAGANGVKFVNTTVTSYATGNGIPVITSGATGPRVAQIFNGTLLFSDTVGSSGNGPGIYACSGTPEPVANGTSSSTQLLSEAGQPADFAISPDGQTVYIADSEAFNGTNMVAGGIQRWDTNVAGGGWTYAYTLAPVNGATNGAQGLTVYFPPGIASWGTGVTGAVLYATSYGATTNSLSQIVDNGAGSTATVIATAGPNQALRGVRFGPAAIPVAIAGQPQSQTNFPNNNVTFTVAATGSQPIYYQWQFNGANIPGATQSTFTTNNVSMASSGNYTVIVSNLVPSSVTSSNAVLTVTAGAPVFTVGVPSYNEGAGDHIAFVPAVTGSTPLTVQWYFNSTNNPIAGATNLALVLTNIQPAQSGTYLCYVANLYGSAHSSGTLTVTPAPVPLSSNNIVVMRIGDGVQALSGVTGNTLYLDQYTPSGTYVSSMQIPDEGLGMPYGTGAGSSSNLPPGSQPLLVAGGNSPSGDAAFEGLLTRSADGQTLNFAGYVEAYPFPGPDLTVGAGGGPNWRGIGSVDAFGYYSTVFTNTGLYSAGNHVIHSAVSLDQTNYWTSGEAGSGGAIKYVTPSFEPANGFGIVAVGGSAAGTRQVQIIGGNLFISDMQASPAGIYQFSGTPESASSPSLFITETNSPMDFAISPDNQTVYIADNGVFVGTNAVAGGIQRWDVDTVHGGYALSYTLGTGAGLTAGARGLTVDFSAQTTWGAGVTGAKLFATTSEASGNRLIRLVDSGPASAATTLVTAATNSTLSGVKFGPVAVPVSFAAEPQNTTAVIGTGASFSAAATGSTPIYYQWQFNGTNLPGATQSSLTVNAAQAALPGSYTVIVSNQMPSTATSAPVTITLMPVLTFNGNGAGWATNGTANSGLPNFAFNGNTNMVELTQGVANQASSAFYDSPVYVGGFQASWTYQVINPSGNVADGVAFVVQNDSRGASALGSGGGALGYGSVGAITNSVALEMNIYTNATGGDGIALDTNGGIGPNVSASPVLLGSGDPINVTVQYVNGLASVTLFDTVTSNTFTTNIAVNVPAVVGGIQAYVGFTGADGAVFSTQTVSNFVFTSLVGLTAQSTGGNMLSLTWPTAVGGYVLQKNSDLTSTNWVNATNAVSVVNGSNQAIVPVTGGSVFYRLVIP